MAEATPEPAVVENPQAAEVADLRKQVAVLGDMLVAANTEILNLRFAARLAAAK